MAAALPAQARNHHAPGCQRPVESQSLTLVVRAVNDTHDLVQKMFGHASLQMTTRYASLHDGTVRAAFDDYQQRRVNIAGLPLAFDPDAPAADAEWIKHNLARVQASLPNGYCGRPPQQDCPHPNACLTCPDFQTIPTFLPLLRHQHDDTLELIDLAQKNETVGWPPTTARSPRTSNGSSPRLNPWKPGGSAHDG